MAKTKTRPGPKPTKGERRDYHILLPLDLAEQLERASKPKGVIAYVERVLRNHFAGHNEFSDPLKTGPKTS